MKGSTLRPKLPDGCVRVVISVDDSCMDSFIPFADANKRLAWGELREIDLGPAFPHSYMTRVNHAQHTRTKASAA
jgi:hypothetical protein